MSTSEDVTAVDIQIREACLRDVCFNWNWTGAEPSQPCLGTWRPQERLPLLHYCFCMLRNPILRFILIMDIDLCAWTLLCTRSCQIAFSA